MATPTKKQRFKSCHAAYIAAKQGTRPKQQAKSIQTKPVVPVPPLPEAEVLKKCLEWLKARRVFCDRHDCGTGPGHARYGIKSAGDIIGILPDGRHFEIEVKHGKGGRLSQGQQQRMTDVRAVGGVYHVVHGTSELEYFLGDMI